MGAEMEPGQSPAGGSGQEPNLSNTGGDYGTDDFLRDLIADGIVEGKDQERGATPPAQSAKGTEPGAEPQQEKPTEEQPKPTEPTQEGKPTEEAAAQPPTGEQLSPEELKRREEQSFKDKFYAAEQEKERLLEQLNTRQQSDTFAQIEAQHIQFTQPQRNLVNSLYEQWKAASDNGDTDAANILAQQWGNANQTLQVMDWQYTQGLEGRKKAAEQAKQETHKKVVDRQLKEDFDTSIEELLKVKPDLNPFDPFSLQKAVALLQKDRHANEIKRVREEAEKFRNEARDKWLAENPGSQADRSGTVTGAARSDKTDFSGMSVDDILSESLGELLAPKSRR